MNGYGRVEKPVNSTSGGKKNSSNGENKRFFKTKYGNRNSLWFWQNPHCERVQSRGKTRQFHTVLRVSDQLSSNGRGWKELAREGTMNRDIFCSCINLNQIHIQEKCGTSVGKELLLYTHLIWIGIQPWQLCHLSFIAIRYIPDSRIPILKSLVLRFTHWGQILFEVAIEYLMFYHLHL